MGYRIYHSDAFVLSFTPRREADGAVDLFTRTHGRLQALAQSARLERSKLRYALQPFTRARVALVRGRAQWRVTGAHARENPLMDDALDAEMRLLVRRVWHVMARLVRGEMPLPALFSLMEHFYDALAPAATCAAHRKVLERFTLYLMCAHLGYAGKESIPSLAWLFQEEHPLAPAALARGVPHCRALTQRINAALAESHL